MHPPACCPLHACQWRSLGHAQKERAAPATHAPRAVTHIGALHLACERPLMAPRQHAPHGRRHARMGTLTRCGALWRRTRRASTPRMSRCGRLACCTTPAVHGMAWPAPQNMYPACSWVVMTAISTSRRARYFDDVHGPLTIIRFRCASPLRSRPRAPQGYIPLQWAALNNRVAECTYLLSNGADINAADPTGQTALHWAAVRGSLPVLETLLRNGADAALADARGYTVCHVAAQYGQTAVLFHLTMKWGVDVDSPDSDGRTPLHWVGGGGLGPRAGGVLDCAQSQHAVLAQLQLKCVPACVGVFGSTSHCNSTAGCRSCLVRQAVPCQGRGHNCLLPTTNYRPPTRALGTPYGCCWSWTAATAWLTRKAARRCTGPRSRATARPARCWCRCAALHGREPTPCGAHALHLQAQRDCEHV